VTPPPDDVDGVLAFLRSAERLKTLHRSAWTSAGEPESVAQHTWRLCLMATVLVDRYPDVDAARLLKICVVHDLGEAIHGDVPAVDQDPDDGKAAREREDLCELLKPLPEDDAAEILELWDEYEAAETAEARLAKALDKLETILQHNQGDNPYDFDYHFNLEYGTDYTTGDPLVEAIRERLDRETEDRAAEQRAMEEDPEV
jgi:putative hydrolase of HD superfamily